MTGLALEFGTQPLLTVMQALRAEQWLQGHAAEATPEQARAIKRALRDAIYVEEPQWKEQVLAQSLEAIAQAVEGLRAD